MISLGVDLDLLEVLFSKMVYCFLTQAPLMFVKGTNYFSPLLFSLFYFVCLLFFLSLVCYVHILFSFYICVLLLLCSSHSTCDSLPLPMLLCSKDS